MQAIYRLDSRTLALLRGHTVDIDPWEQGVAWAYGLHWLPQPVFQDYQAYTPTLDRDNAATLASPRGPQRVLRENVPKVLPEYPTSATDGRYPAWDPPAAAIAMLCHYVPLRTTGRWQVLGRSPNRCGRPHLLTSARTSYGETVRVPASSKGEAVFAKIHGAGVSGLERVESFFARAHARYATVNGSKTYRLVPGTAGDGLIMSVPKGADFPGRGFSLSPNARRLSLTGTSGELTIDVFGMSVRSLVPRAPAQ
jgi:hypothetical protein